MTTAVAPTGLTAAAVASRVGVPGAEEPVDALRSRGHVVAMTGDGDRKSVV